MATPHINETKHKFSNEPDCRDEEKYSKWTSVIYLFYRASWCSTRGRDDENSRKKNSFMMSLRLFIVGIRRSLTHVHIELRIQRYFINKSKNEI